MIVERISAKQACEISDRSYSKSSFIDRMFELIIHQAEIGKKVINLTNCISQSISEEELEQVITLFESKGYSFLCRKKHNFIIRW